jgi:acyl-CoA thioesterase
MDTGLENWLHELLYLRHDLNIFAKFMGMEIVDISLGGSIVRMAVSQNHTNVQGEIHGGGLVSLADMAMGLACNSYGKRLVTLDLNISFIRRTRVGNTVTAYSKVIHNGKTTFVVVSDIRNSLDMLLANARATFFVVGEYTVEDLRLLLEKQMNKIRIPTRPDTAI